MVESTAPNNSEKMIEGEPLDLVKAQAASDLEAWKIRQQIESEQRYTTEASYKGLEPSLTNRLRNISTTGSIQRATQELKTQSRLLREGKRYQR